MTSARNYNRMLIALAVFCILAGLVAIGFILEVTR